MVAALFLFQTMAKKEKLQTASISFEEFVQQQLIENPHFSLETVKIIWSHYQINNTETTEQ
jgi:hypothetical protein